MTAGIDFHTSNLLFALSVDIDSWTVQELYAALGGEPVTVPFSAALGSRPVPVEVPAHTPKYLVCAPPVPKLWALCHGSAQSIRVIDFGESFSLPFSGQELPGTPLQFAAPELLLELPSHITEAIDIWALGSTIYALLGREELVCSMGYLPHHISIIVGLFGGKESMPESFWNAYCAAGMLKHLDEVKNALSLDWDRKIRVDRSVGLKKKAEEVLRRVVRVSMVIDPVHRAKAQAIVAMMPEAWETMEAISDDEEESIETLSDDEEESIENLSDDEEESIEALSDDEEEPIQPLSDDEEESIQPLSEDDEESIQESIQPLSDDEEESIQPLAMTVRVNPRFAMPEERENEEARKRRIEFGLGMAAVGVRSQSGTNQTDRV